MAPPTDPEAELVRRFPRRAFLIGAAASAGLVIGGGVLAAVDRLEGIGGRDPGAGSPDPGPLPVATPSPLELGSASPSASASAVVSPDPTPMSSPTPGPTRPPRRMTVARENARSGSSAWNVGRSGSSDAEGYVDRVSAAPGDTVTMHASASGPIDIEWYRLGWYSGLGGRLVRTDRDVRASRVPRPTQVGTMGLAEATFPVVLTIEIPTDWASGVYLAVLRPRQGRPGCVPLVIRSARPTAPVLFVTAPTTWQAYNNWGGHSLYSYNSSGFTVATGSSRAAQVSFDRPFAAARGAGLLFNWEHPMVLWQERTGRDVEYVADADLELHPESIAGHRLVIFAGHHEYWSRPMRTTLERAIAAGTNVAFLSANEIYWQARLERGADGFTPGRRVTCYKSAARDPMAATNPSLTTCRWREAPVFEPEAALVGQMYGHVVSRSWDWIVRNDGHWLYQATGLRNGDHLANLVGQEYDTHFPTLGPPNVEILASSPVSADPEYPDEPGNVASPALHTATMYAHPSGATVFAAGTFQWSWGLDARGNHVRGGRRTPPDPRVERMTHNLFARLGGD